MRIVHIDEMFHPSFGYQINSLAKYQALQGHEVIVLTAPHDNLRNQFKYVHDTEQIPGLDREYEDKTGVKIIRLPVTRYVSGRAIFTKELWKALKDSKPDVVMAHQIETYSSMMYLLKGFHRKYPTISDSHMLRMASKNKHPKVFSNAFSVIFTPIIKRNKITVIRTQDDDYVNAMLHIPENLTPFVSFGSDLTLFHKDSEARDKFRKDNNISEEAFVIVYTGKFDNAKGGKLLAEAIKEKISAANGREIVFVIVGNTVKNESDEYGREVERIFEESENRVLRFPTQKFTDLAPFYQASDLSIFAKQCSLSFYDAQACGLPVVFEDNNVNIDRAKFGNGLTFKAGSIEDFREKMLLFANMSKEEWQKYSDNSEKLIIENYGYDKIASQYTKAMEEKMAEFNKK